MPYEFTSSGILCINHINCRDQLCVNLDTGELILNMRLFDTYWLYFLSVLVSDSLPLYGIMTFAPGRKSFIPWYPASAITVILYEFTSSGILCTNHINCRDQLCVNLDIGELIQILHITRNV